MKAILSKIIKNLNGHVLEVTTEEVEVNDYTDYYPLIGNDCRTFDVVMPNENISIFVDDEGLMKPKNFGRKVEGYPEPLFGNLVFCGGVDSKGDTLDTTLSVEDVKQMVGAIQWITE